MTYIISGHNPRAGLRGSLGSYRYGDPRMAWGGTAYLDPRTVRRAQLGALGAGAVRIEDTIATAAAAAGIPAAFFPVVVSVFAKSVDAGTGLGIPGAIAEVKRQIAAAAPGTPPAALPGAGPPAGGRPGGGFTPPAGGGFTIPGGDVIRGLGTSQNLMLAGAAAILVGVLVLGRRKGGGAKAGG